MGINHFFTYTKLGKFIVKRMPFLVVEYEVEVFYHISAATFLETTEIKGGTLENLPSGIFFSEHGTKMHVYEKGERIEYELGDYGGKVETIKEVGFEHTYTIPPQKKVKQFRFKRLFKWSKQQ